MQCALMASGGVAKDVGWLVVPALCLTAVMVSLGYLVTHVLPSTAIGRWDADVPRRLLEYRQADENSESKIITTLSATPTIVVLTVLAAIVFRWMFGRWREALVVIYAVVGETAIFMATTMLIDRPRPNVTHLDVAPPTSSFPSGHTAAAVCFYGSIAAIVVWHSRRRWIGVVAVIVCAAVPLTIAVTARVPRYALPDGRDRRRASGCVVAEPSSSSTCVATARAGARTPPSTRTRGW